jgi:hypothetical protein
MNCCGMSWVGPDRAHCCRRTRGCGQVFDDATLFDAHRHIGACLAPRTLGLIQTRNGIWLQPLTHPSTTSSTPKRRHTPVAHRRDLAARHSGRIPRP